MQRQPKTEQFINTMLHFSREGLQDLMLVNASIYLKKTEDEDMRTAMKVGCNFISVIVMLQGNLEALKHALYIARVTLQ